LSFLDHVLETSERIIQEPTGIADKENKWQEVHWKTEAGNKML
jgi:hypothetical protein